MHYCSAEKLSKSYGIQPLFDTLSFHINKGDRISLIAKNGTGKSSFLNVLTHKEPVDGGKVVVGETVVVVPNKIPPMFSKILVVVVVAVVGVSTVH